MIKTRFFSFFGVLLLIIGLPASSQTDDGALPVRLTLTPLATFTNPFNDFGENYLSGVSGGIKLGINSDLATGKLGFDEYLAWYNDRFKLRGSNDYGTLNTISANWDFYLFYLTSGMGWGVSRFDVADGVYQRLGDNTGTELQEKNKRWDFSYDRYFGLRVPVVNFLALDCQYHFISVEKTWMSWHSSISGSIIEITELPFEGIASEMAKQDNLPVAIIMELISAGISWAWYRYDYNHHNWPWHDEPPMRFGRASIGVTFLIGSVPE